MLMLMNERPVDNRSQYVSTSHRPTKLYVWNVIYSLNSTVEMISKTKTVSMFLVSRKGNKMKKLYWQPPSRCIKKSHNQFKAKVKVLIKNWIITIELIRLFSFYFNWEYCAKNSLLVGFLIIKQIPVLDN